MTQLTKNFSLEELTESATARMRHLPNVPNKTETDNLKLLAETVLQPLRDLVGPITVTSGFRSKTLNSSIGGVATSFHVKGQAADIQCAAGNVSYLLWVIVNSGIPFTELIHEYGNWIHIAYDKRKGNKREILAYHKNGKFKLNENNVKNWDNMPPFMARPIKY